MKMLNVTDMNLVNGGFGTNPTTAMAKRRKLRTEKWVAEEKARLEGLADIRMRAAEDALMAAMRQQHADMEIKAAQRAAMELD